VTIIGRRVTAKTLKLILAIIDLLRRSKHPISTKEILLLLLKKNIYVDYSKLYQCLRMLSRKNILIQTSYGKMSFWELNKGLERREILQMLGVEEYS